MAFCLSPTLPATATMPSTSISAGEPSAKRIATASSWPGSVSIIILRRMGLASFSQKMIPPPSIKRVAQEQNSRRRDCPVLEERLATRAPGQTRAVPVSMSAAQFERVMANASRLAILILGALAFLVALSLGKVILAPISLAIFVGLMFGPLADWLEHRGVAPAL